MIVQSSTNDYEKLINIWENSVRETHSFLMEEDIQFYKPLILKEYFPQVDLYCHKDDNQRINGFMGIVGDKLEMLFIDSGKRGKGIGKVLLDYAINERNVKWVDVNEQNSLAVGFYQHMGFQVVSRSELDGTGKPYPILSMEYIGNPQNV